MAMKNSHSHINMRKNHGQPNTEQDLLGQDFQIQEDSPIQLC